MPDEHWFDPAAIEYKITPVRDLHGVKAGDWDIERRIPVRDTAKYRAMVARFVDGQDWLSTDLFADVYARRMKQEGRVGRSRSLADLAMDYETRFTKLRASLEAGGFRTEASGGRKLPLLTLLIGRGGEIFIGNQGNHRLALAHILGLDRVAGRIVCRHANWTG